MRFVIALARRNVLEKTGGPFGAAVFEEETGCVVAVGVNRVVPSNQFAAHAEMLALMLAQDRLAAFRLDRIGNYSLATSAQPCSMCFGAIPWTGIRRLLVGARREDVEALSAFDEGPLPRNWKAVLEERGIEVVVDVCREEACSVFPLYEARSGEVY